MWQQILSNSFVLVLGMGIMQLAILYFINNTQTAKTYASTTRTWLLISVLCLVLMNGKSFNTINIERNAYTLLFMLFSGINMYIMLILSYGWFANIQRTGCRYNVLILASYACTYIMLETENMGILMIGYIIWTFINYALLKINYEKQIVESAKRYLIISVFIVCLSALSLIYIKWQGLENYNYSNISAFLSNKEQSLPLFLAIMGIMVPLFYALNIAPFHIMAEEKQSRSILPVAHYFAIIPLIIFFSILLKINQIFYPIFPNRLIVVYRILAIISIIFGAIGTNARMNLHQICAYSTTFHMGIALLLISFENPVAIEIAVIYLFIYLIALAAIYTVCYNLRSHGEYLSSITSLAGMAENRPCATGTLLAGLFSMMGLPPLSGFLGQLNVVYELLNQEAYALLLVVIISLLLIIRAYLGIIKTVFFEKKIKSFDTENKYVLICSALYILAIIGLTFNPLHIFEHIKDMFNVILL